MENMIKNFKSDIWEPDVQFEFEEASGEVDGQHILGKVKGTFFVPDGTSRNNRYYPKALWEKVLADSNVTAKLKERRMYGSISHDQKLDDLAILEGKISHVVTNLAIEGNSGKGEALILGTPAGKILNTMLRAKCKLFVSSRAEGQFKGEHNGIPIVDPATYKITTWDFVIDPGFLQANPGIVESLNKLAEEEATRQPQASNTKLDTKGDKKMETNTSLVESLAKENGSLKAELERATGELETMKNENVTINDTLKHTKFELEKIQGYKKTSESFKTKLESYEALGTLEEMTQLVESVEKLIVECGTFAEIKEALVGSQEKIEAYKKFGTPKAVGEALHKAHTALVEYRKRATLPELDAILSKYAKTVEEGKEAKKKSQIETLAKELGVTEERVAKLWGKMTEAEIREFLADFKESSKIQSTFRKKAVDEDKKPEPKKDGEGDTGAKFNRPLGERLFGSILGD